ncbi:MAG: hypothetical protein ND895_08730 [Pyrinomonadaceae bacterium]|nr:hypothetical protein [Pyrinomonadaceae bacterium]
MPQGKFTRHDGALLLTVLVGLASVVGLSRWIDAHRPAANVGVEEEVLYLNAATVRRLSLGFNGLAADWYWMRSLQYVGGKIIKLPEHVSLDRLGQLNLKLLAPLLDASTTLDPQFMEPYQYAAVVLPDVEVQEAIRIVRKGIAANPLEWRLYHHLGFIYWQQRDFKMASEIYGEGAAIAGAPPWMNAMKAQLAVEGGSRSTARQIYERMFQESDDPNVREMARKRLLQIQSFDERDEIRRVLTAHAARAKRCASSWRDVSAALRQARLRLDSSGAPIDPANVQYALVKDGCDVDLDWYSEIPRP